MLTKIRQGFYNEDNLQLVKTAFIGIYPKREERMSRKAFTLVELIVVIAIIAILAATIAPNAFRAIEKAKIVATITDYKAVKTGTLTYYIDTGGWPTDGVTTSGLVASDGRANWNGPYLEKWPQGKWGVSSVYTFQNDSVYDWDGLPAASPSLDPARYLEISAVPLLSARNLDRQADGIEGSTVGLVRYASTDPTTTIRMFIAADVGVN